MQKLNLLFFISLFFVFSSCSQKQPQLFSADNSFISYNGRVDFTDKENPVLIGSASFVEVNFEGDSCTIFLQKNNPKGEYNFVSIEQDGEYRGRIKLEKEGMIAYPLQVNQSVKNHHLKIYKATEASNNTIVFGGIKCLGLNPKTPAAKLKMEFIGNSITCGMGIDWKEIPCHTGVWFDQHNAYFSYGKLVSDELQAQLMLSSVSGIGIYRNWNSEGPVMPEVYENRYLNTDATKKWDFSLYTPDIVSIALGTNDFSDGDGSYKRMPFDSARYVNNYINFVETIYSHYPETQICLLTSPMVQGENAQLFERCLSAVKAHFDREKPAVKNIELFFFSGIEPQGCDGHPDKEDHQKMAEMLVPFYQKVINANR